MKNVWNVYLEDVNKQEIIIYNIFNHAGFDKDYLKIYRQYKPSEDRNGFEKEISKILRYYFDNKCEYEIILSDWPPSSTGKFKNEKVSVYDQLILNWDIFVDFLFR